MNDTLDQIEAVFRCLRRELWIVTAAIGDRRGGLVATWVSQASLDREHSTVIAGIAPNHFTSEMIDDGGSFALHLIASEHISHAWNFAIGSGRDRDKLADAAVIQGATGAPILRDCLAWLDCRVFAVLRTGDRNFYWADVLAGKVVQPGKPLTEQDLLAQASDEQKQHLRADRDGDVNVQRPLQAIWRDNLPELLRFP